MKIPLIILSVALLGIGITSYLVFEQQQEEAFQIQSQQLQQIEQQRLAEVERIAEQEKLAEENERLKIAEEKRISEENAVNIFEVVDEQTELVSDVELVDLEICITGICDWSEYKYRFANHDLINYYLVLPPVGMRAFPYSVASVMESALGEWSELNDNRFVFTQVGSYEGAHLLISFHKDSTSSAHASFSQSSIGKKPNIMFDGDHWDCNGNQMYLSEGTLYGLMLHETGHFLGLGHSKTKGLMYSGDPNEQFSEDVFNSINLTIPPVPPHVLVFHDQYSFVLSC